MQPKRQYERFAVDFMDVHGKVLFKTNVKIVNMSISGVSFRSDKRLTIGETYFLKLERKGKERKIFTFTGNDYMDKTQ